MNESPTAIELVAITTGCDISTHPVTDLAGVRVYVTALMEGRELSLPTLVRAGLRLRNAGASIVTAATAMRTLDFDDSREFLDEDDYFDAVAASLSALRGCDALVLLPGSPLSERCRQEARTAARRGMALLVYDPSSPTVVYQLADLAAFDAYATHTMAHFVNAATRHEVVVA